MLYLTLSQFYEPTLALSIGVTLERFYGENYVLFNGVTPVLLYGLPKSIILFFWSWMLKSYLILLTLWVLFLELLMQKSYYLSVFIDVT